MIVVINTIAALDHAARDILLHRLSRHLEYTCILAMPTGQPLEMEFHEALAFDRDS